MLAVTVLMSATVAAGLNAGSVAASGSASGLGSGSANQDVSTAMAQREALESAKRMLATRTARASAQGLEAAQERERQLAADASDDRRVRRAERNSRQAAQVATGGLQGVLRDAETTDPITSGCVIAVEVNDDREEFTACVDSAGRYTLPLAVGTYDVSFVAGDYLAEDSFGEVVDGGMRTLDAALSRGGTLSGVLRQSGTGNALTDACVFVTAAGHSFSTSSTCALDNGAYNIGRLRPGRYSVQITSPDHVDTYVGGDSPGEATLFTVLAGQSTTVDAALQRGGGISGRVTIAGSNGEYCARALRADSLSYAGEVCQFSGDPYQLRGLAPGPYLVQFSAGNAVTEWYDDAESASAGTPVTVSDNVTTSGIDAELAPGGVIEGQVRTAGGADIVHACVVSIYTTGGEFITTACTDEQGSYRASGLRAGNYLVEFRSQPWQRQHFVAEWWDDKPDRASATPVSVTVGQTTAANAVVESGQVGSPNVSGHVRSAKPGALMDDYCIDLYRTRSGPGYTYDEYVTGNCWYGSENDGAWSFEGLAEGTYHAWVYSFTRNSTHIGLRERNAFTLGGAPVTDVDFELEVGASVSGRLTDRELGTPLDGGFCIWVTPVEADGYSPPSNLCTYVVSGRYRTTIGYPPGEYRVGFHNYAGRYADEGYSAPSAPDPAGTYAGTVVALSGTEQVNGIDEDLDIGATISGRITVPNGAGDSTVCPYLVDEQGAQIGSSSCSTPGRYVLTAPAGTYRVGAHGYSFDQDRGFATQFFDHVETVAEATVVETSHAAPADDVDFDLKWTPVWRQGPAVVGDFDGDGATDHSVYRAGRWLSDSGVDEYFGLEGWASVPSDLDGDAVEDLAVWDSQTGAWHSPGLSETVYFGLSSDTPVPADYDGDGDDDIAVWRKSTGGWHVQGQAVSYLGLSTDVPVPGDYDGDGNDEVAVFRPSTGAWFLGGSAPVYFGLPGDVPVPADYDGDGADEIAVWRPSTGAWFVDAASSPAAYYGLSTDVPVPGYYDGGDSARRAVYRPTSGAWLSDGVDPVYFGRGGDRPLTLSWAIWDAYFAD